MRSLRCFCAAVAFCAVMPVTNSIAIEIETFSDANIELSAPSQTEVHDNDADLAARVAREPDDAQRDVAAASQSGIAATTAAVAKPVSAAGAKRIAASSASAKTRRSFSGAASFYWQAQKLASGETFSPDGLSAAHRTLPFGTKVRVTDPKSGRNVVVRINDRGPFTKGRVLDLSRGAAKVLGMTDKGIINVVADVLDDRGETTGVAQARTAVPRRTAAND